jgi:hypothetical protein
MPMHSESVRVFRQNNRQWEREIIQKANVTANEICFIDRAGEYYGIPKIFFRESDRRFALFVDMPSRGRNS